MTPLVLLSLLGGCDDTIFGGGHGSVEVSGEDFCAVTSIFAAECLICHSAAAPSGDLDLETDPYAALLDQPSALYADQTLVVAGDSASSFLYQKVAALHDGSTEGNAMPPSDGLGEELSGVIASWIDAGALQECAEAGDTGGGEADVAPYDAMMEVINMRCTTGCHDAESNRGGLDLVTDPYTAMTETVSSGGYAYLVDCDADSSFFYQKVTNTQPSDGGGAMPQGTSGLEAEEAALVRTWIEHGAPGAGEAGSYCATKGGSGDSGDSGSSADSGGDSGSAERSPDLCTVQEIFNSGCLGCHSSSYAEGDLDLSQTDLLPALLTASDIDPKMQIVAPYSPDDSLLYLKLIDAQSKTQGMSMPAHSSPLPDEDIALIHEWITLGATADCAR